MRVRANQWPYKVRFDKGGTRQLLKFQTLFKKKKNERQNLFFYLVKAMKSLQWFMIFTKAVFDSAVKKFGKMFYTLNGVWVNMKICSN